MKLLKNISSKSVASIFALIFLFSFTQNSFAQEQRVSSDVKEVKVYFRGAEVIRNAKTTLPKGTTLLIFEDIADEIEASSIQAAVSKGVEVLSVSHSINHAKEQGTNANINKLNDSVKLINDYLKNIEIANNVMGVEEGILNLNRNAGGTQQGVNSVELQKILDMNRKRMTEIQQEKYANSKKSAEAMSIRTKLFEKINKEKEKLSKARGEIRLMVSVSTPVQASFELKYLAFVAGWIPFYDVYTEGPGKPAKFTYKAEIAQSTGEIWENVKLKLSSANPQIGITLPGLSTEYVSFNPPVIYKNQGYNTDNRMMFENSSQQMKKNDIKRLPTRDVNQIAGITPGVSKGKFNEAEEDEEDFTSNQSIGAALSSNEIVFEFDIAQPFSIPNDGKGRALSVKDFELDMKYEYFSIPKLDCAVFLTGVTTDWKKLNILPGNANMFFGNNYTGKLYLNPSVDDDSLRFSFGRDKRILIERKQLNDFSKKSFFGSTKKETYNYEIKLNNTQNTDINVHIIDQIPISRNAEIKVEVDELGTGVLNAETGWVEWKFALKASESKTIKFAYSVTSPKAKRVYKN